MNTIVERMLIASKKEAPAVHDAITLNTIHYYLGTLATASLARYRFDSNNIPINFYGVTLAESGGGKDRSVEIVKRMVADGLAMYQYKLELEFDKFVKKMPMKERFSIPWLEFGAGTAEGIMETRNHISMVGFGVTNWVVPEIQDALAESDGIMSQIVKAWERGNTDGKNSKSTKYPPVNDVPMNVLCYGSPMKSRDDFLSMEKLRNALSNGLARRSFVVSIPRDETLNLQKEHFKSKSKPFIDHDEIKALNAILKSAMMSYKCPIELEDEVVDLFYEYDMKCKLSVEDPNIPTAVFAEAQSRAWKALRLAALYAFIEGSSKISEKNFQDSIEYSDFTSGFSMEILRDIPVEEKVYKFIKTNGPVTEQQIRNVVGIKNKNEFADMLMMADSLADENGDAMVTSDERIVKYSISELTGIDLDAITISTSTQLSDNWKPLVGKWKDLPSFFKTGTWYSAGTFKGGHRNNDNYENSQDLMIFDIDDGMTLTDAKSFFADFRCIIATTKSHQIEKHPGTGDIWDRFRIILVPDVKIELDVDTYSKFMVNAMDMMGIPADRKAIDPARFFFGNKDAEVWVSEGTKLFPVNTCIPSTTKAEIVHKRLENYDSVEGAERYFIASTDKGDRNNKLYQYAKMIQDDNKYSQEEVETMVRELNAKIADPLPDRELERTILKSIRK